MQNPNIITLPEGMSAKDFTGEQSHNTVLQMKVRRVITKLKEADATITSALTIPREV